MPKETILRLQQFCQANPEICQSLQGMFEGTIIDLYSEAHLGGISVSRSGNLFTVKIKMEHNGVQLVHLRNHLGPCPTGRDVFNEADDDFYAMKHYLDAMKIAELKPANMKVTCLMYKAEALISVESPVKTLRLSWYDLGKMAYSNDNSQLKALFE